MFGFCPTGRSERSVQNGDANRATKGYGNLEQMVDITLYLETRNVKHNKSSNSTGIPIIQKLMKATRIVPVPRGLEQN